MTAQKQATRLQTTAIKASSHSAWFPTLPEQLNAAVQDYRLPDTTDWNPLAELSTNTEFEGIDVFGSDAVAEHDQFIAPATVYVRLIYGPDIEPSAFSDSYPARVFFTVSSEQGVKVNRIEVDTSSFYE